jgi:hypothetical protein
VLSVAKLTVGQEAYYEQQVATGLDDYFAGRESPGMWAGSSAEELRLARTTLSKYPSMTTPLSPDGRFSS